MNTSTKQEQVYQELKQRIKYQIYRPGIQLPKEIDLAKELKVSRQTLRPALARLENEQWLKRLSGKGTFVRGLTDKATKILILQKDLSSLSNSTQYILPYIQEACLKNNVKGTVLDINLILEQQEADVLEKIHTGGYAGILCFDCNFIGDEPLLKLLKQTKLPVFLPHAYRNDHLTTGFPVMGMDYTIMIEDGLSYLSSMGHRRVAFLGDTHMRGMESRDYFRFLRLFNLDPAPELMCLTNASNPEKIIQGLHHLFTNLEPRPTALFCYSDFVAMQAYKLFKKMGISIPDEVAVLTIGGQIGCDFMDPPLSSIEYGNGIIGDSAITLLLDIISRRRLNMGFIVTPHQLRERKSTERIICTHPKTGGQHESKP